MPVKVMITTNTAWNLVNFRVGLLQEMQSAGYEVVTVSPYDEYAPELQRLGFKHVVLPMDNRGSNPIKDMLLFRRFLRLMREEMPAVYLGYTIKPNIYGSLAAQWLGIPVINNISGLGATFIQHGLMTRIDKSLYWLALRRSSRVLFQNQEDQQLFIDNVLVNAAITDLVPGSGVDLTHFYATPLPARRKPFQFLLMARMLWDKGVGEFIAAAKLVRARYPDAEFYLLGFVGVANPKAISKQEMAMWTSEPGIYFIGHTNDVRPYIEASHCVVLPSYREGTPRSLLEAAAMGRPLIATDVPGCHDVVDDGVNGYLCQVRDADDLARQMMRMMLLSNDELASMGMASRKKVERQFDEKIVILKYMQAIQEILKC